MQVSQNRCKEYVISYPKRVEGLDVAKIKLHLECFQRFTKNLDWLKPVAKSLPFSSIILLTQRHCFLFGNLDKKALQKNHLSYFLPINVYFVKGLQKQNKKQEQKEGPNEAFASRKHKSFGLESIKKMAKEIQNNAYSSLFHRVTVARFPICLQLKYIFMNHAIIIFTANTNHLRYIFCRHLEKPKELKNCCLRRMLQHKRE